MINLPTSPAKDDDKLTKRVKDLIRREKADQAIAILEASTSKSPRDWYPTYLLGWVHEGLGRDHAALASYRRALTLAPWNEQLKVVTCQLLLRANQPAEALPHAEAIVRTWPSSSEARSLLGRALLDLGRIDEAESALKIAIQLSDDNPDARKELARLFEKTNRDHLVQPLLKDYLASAPQLASSHAFWADFQFFDLGNCQEALPHYEKALMLYIETNRPGYFLQYSSTGDYPESIIEDYVDALTECGMADVAQNIAATHFSRPEFEVFQSDHFERLGQTERALEKMRKALKSRPTAYNWLSRLARLHLKLGEFHEAEVEARKELEPTSDSGSYYPWLQASLIVSLSKQGKRAEAEDLQNSVPEADREPLQVALIDIYAMLKDWDQVITTSEELVKTNSKIAPVVMRLAEALVATGQYGAAIERYLSLIGKQPDNPRLWLALARAQIRAGDPQSAKASLHNTLQTAPLSSSLRQEAEPLLNQLDASGEQ